MKKINIKTGSCLLIILVLVAVFLIGGLKLYHTLYPFSQVRLGFIGDSVTYGFDPDNHGKRMNNPWVQQVGKKLHAKEVKNYGVNSASVMNQKGTAMAVINDYQKMDDSLDIVGVMIGINDAYREYPLGSFSDRTEDTFYGSLHIMWQRILHKYPPDHKKKVFLILYPQYDVFPNWKYYREALLQVADYYSIPVCDLSKELGMSPYIDSGYEYWRKQDYKGNEGLHSAHPTQRGANLYADVIANFINSHFMIR